MANTKPASKKQKRAYTVRICTSLKACGENYGPYNWERMCNEHGIDPSEESFTTKKGHTFQKSPCQGMCKKKSNVQVKDENGNITQFSYMTPLKSAKLSNSIQSGADPKNIKRL